MAKVFIEETTLTAIGDAIRGKEGTTELVPVTDMATRITSLPSGGNEPTDEELTITGDCSYRFAYDGWNWVIDKFGNRITTKDITRCSNMFNLNFYLTDVLFDINIKDCAHFDYMFANCNELRSVPRIRGTIKWNASTTFGGALNNAKCVRNWDDLVTPEMLDGFSTVKVTSSYSAPQPTKFDGNYSLRTVPSWWYKFKLNPESTVYPAGSYTLYYKSFSNCYALDEVLNIPVWKCAGAQTSNMFGSTFTGTYRLKAITFETNEDGSAIVTEWKSQTIDLTDSVGYAGSVFATNDITAYNSGITTDKLVYSAATYQALKNDPDWYSGSRANDVGVTAPYYSRYNKISAINTINSLPDTSAYLATAGGTNTIKFKGISGGYTDGGAINTMTEEEIAVATAKGWTVTFA